MKNEWTEALALICITLTVIVVGYFHKATIETTEAFNSGYEEVQNVGTHGYHWEKAK